MNKSFIEEEYDEEIFSENSKSEKNEEECRSSTTSGFFNYCRQIYKSITKTPKRIIAGLESITEKPDHMEQTSNINQSAKNKLALSSQNINSFGDSLNEDIKINSQKDPSD